MVSCIQQTDAIRLAERCRSYKLFNLIARHIHVNAPIIEEYPLTLECKVKSWDGKTGYLIGEIVASQADESILTDGKVDLGKLRPIIFDPSFNAYRVVGEIVGKAFSDGLKLK